MIAFILFFALAHVGILADITWLWASAMVLGLSAIIGGRIYVHFSKRFRNVLDDIIQIKGMYGTNVNFSEIADVFLLEYSMAGVGIGTRTNGYGGFGLTQKGNFQSTNHEEVLLFVKASSSPTIHIERNNMRDIYLCFGSSEATRQLYREIMAALTHR